MSENKVKIREINPKTGEIISKTREINKKFREKNGKVGEILKKIKKTGQELSGFCSLLSFSTQSHCRFYFLEHFSCYKVGFFCSLIKDFIKLT